MSNPGCTDAQLQEAVDALRAANGIKDAAARSLDIPPGTYRNRIKRAAERGMLGREPVIPGFAISKVSTTLDADGNTVREHIQQKPEIESGPFAIPQGHRVKGVSALVDGNGKVVQQWFKTREGERDPLWVAEKIREAFEGFEPKALASKKPDTDQNIATVIPISDAHYGLYAWGEEAGADYDLSIADRTNREALGRLMASSPASEQAVILGLGDLVHADNSENRTSRSGHALDVDTRYAKVLQTAVLFMIHAVELALDRHGRVLFRNLPGNHDDHTAIAVSTSVWAWFRDHPRVDVDIDPGRFWWFEYGSNLIGATHGDMVKMKDLPMVMAASCPEAWGRTKYRLCLTGHIHHQSAIEQGGVIVESFQSPAARDAWHQAAGYRSGRSLSSITFHKERGEIMRNKVAIS